MGRGGFVVCKPFAFNTITNQYSVNFIISARIIVLLYSLQLVRAHK